MLKEGILREKKVVIIVIKVEELPKLEKANAKLSLIERKFEVQTKAN